MRKIKGISIPEPCSQPWEQMTAIEDGRYCDSCCKTVIDFRTMTDVEIINYFTAKNNACGRFNGEQLDRINLQLGMPDAKAVSWQKKWLITATLLTSTAFFKAAGQTAPVTAKVEQGTTEGYPGNVTEGKIKPVKHHSNEIKGRITDDSCTPLAGATIRVVGTDLALPTDTNGRFKFHLPKTATQFTVSYVGFETATIDIDSLHNGDCNLKLAPQVITMNNVIVVRPSGFTRLRADVTGGAFVVTAVEKKKHSWLWRMYYKYIRTPIHNIFYGAK